VLIADDEDLICHLARAALEAAGFFVLTASDGEQALRLSRSFHGTIHILVSDIVMPKMNGLALREQILRERPAIQVLLMSGQTDQPVENAAFLPKPFNFDDLKERVRQLLGPPSKIRDRCNSRRVSRDKPEVEALGAQVRAAREDLTIAMSHYKDLLERAKASRWKTDADGSEALRQAAAAERRALKQYAKLLDAFTSLVLDSRPTLGDE
jgi:DNA-binding NtrC family response regulator